ncbi:MAG: peptidase renal dipeptidase [Bradyrhizobium sp.]|nr:peptidase renal dipeptidase [Bradyrhizobium sp.]
MGNNGWNRRDAVRFGVLGLASSTLVPLLGSAARATASASDDAVIALHKATLVLDPHADIPDSYDQGPLDAAIDGPTQVDLPKLARGGVGAIGLAAYVPQGPRTEAGYAEAWARAEGKVRIITGLAKNHPDRAGLASSPEDIIAIHKQGKVAILPTVLNGYPIGKDIGKIDVLYGQGIRVFGLTHAGHNDLADSSRPSLKDVPAEHGGLSPLGRDAVDRINACGILLDVCQLSEQSFAQAVMQSKAPVVATHAGIWGMVDNPRNLKDEQLDAIKAKSGVVHVVAFNRYLARAPRDFDARQDAIRAKWNLKPTDIDTEKLSEAEIAKLHTEINLLVGNPDVDALVGQIDYVVRRIGIDHVGIASDFNHGGGIEGFRNEGDALNLTRALVRHGYSKAEIGKIWSGNFLRVLGAAQAGRTG